MKPSVLRTLVLVFIAGLVGYYIGVTKISFAWKGYNPQIQVVGKEPPSGANNLDFSKFWQVMQKIETSYYDKSALNAQKMLDGAILGMVESLDDPYTMYLPAQQNEDFKQVMAGQFQGIGAELGMRGKQIIVVSPIDGSPAVKAGIKPEDAIVKVDDQVTYGWTISQAVEKIRGPKGTKVVLTIVREGSNEPKEVTVTRDTITIKSVTAWTKKVKDIEGIKKDALKSVAEQKIAYIRLSQFGDNTNDEWLSVANKLDMDMIQDESIKGIILDLRNNPGGYLTDAVFIASEFVESGTIVIQEDGKKEQVALPVSRKGLMYDVPIVVLINKGSASASEIVAGALRDYNRATLIGEKSFGKGTIQQAEDLGEGTGIHVTVAKWLTPKGTWVHKTGLEPDIAVALDKNDPERDTQLERAIQELTK